MKKKGCIKYGCLLVIGCFFMQLHLAAQDSLVNAYTDISKIRLVQPINDKISNAFIGKNDTLEASYTGLSFAPGLIYNKYLPNRFVSKKSILRFNITNSADSTVSVYFFPGFYAKDINVYRIAAGRPVRLPNVLPDINDSIGYRLLSLAPHDSATIIAEESFIKTYGNIINARLINVEYINSFVTQLHGSNNDKSFVTYIFCGLLLMMIIFSLANFIQGANPEFFYYSCYALLIGLMLFTKAINVFHSTRFNYFIESYLDFIMQGFGHMFYILFMQRFLNTKTRHPFLYYLYSVCIVLIIVSMLSYSYFHYFTNNFPAENFVENATKVLLLSMLVPFFIYSIFHWKDKLLRYLLWGNVLLFVFSLTSQLLLMLKIRPQQLPDIFGSSIFYYEIGMVLELILFLAGLNYKNRREIIERTKEREGLKAENQLKEYEKELAVYKAQQDERVRISADMHDELGSGMTAIRLLSEIARKKMKENTPVEIEKISSSANDVLNKMNAIIWSMNSGNDTVDNLISYIRSYSIEYFDNTPITCTVNTPENIPDKELTGEKRRNTFLCVKETLNNAWKHSGANIITIDIEANHSLHIRISDNGKGIDLQNLRQFGNGLQNIGRRMESIGGTFTIENNNGTVTTLELPL